MLITRFAEMLTTRSGQDKLEQWIQDAEDSPLPELRGFATGLKKDFTAVLADLSLPGAPARSKATSTGSRC